MASARKKQAKNKDISAYDFTKDIRSYLKSSLFNSYYLEKGFVAKFKDEWIPESPEWDHFYQGIFDFIESKDESFFLDNKPSESLTVDSYILPVMALLGWDKFGLYNHYDTETTYDYDGKSYRPDLVYFGEVKDQEKVQSLKGKIKKTSGKRKKDYQNQLRNHVEKSHDILVEAKMFGLLKNNSKRKDELKKDSTRDKTPEGQTVTYMEMLRSEQAILTDGGVWKFFHNEFRSEEKFVRFDFGKLALWLIRKIKLEGFERGCNEFKREEEEFNFLLAMFYNLFSKEAVLGEKVTHLVENTKKYSEHLEDKIKNRFVMAVTHACNGLAHAVKKSGDNPDDFLDLIKKTAESHLFNIIFFRSLESRGVLPYYGEDNSYDKLSISKTIDSIYENGFNPSQSFKSQLNMFEDYYQERVDSKTSTICSNLIKLYKAVHKGISNGIHIEGFKESVFSREEWDFANKYKIADEYMLNVIFYLNLVPKDRELGEYQLIPYDFLTPRELGSIFESFLEFKITKARTPMFWDYRRKQWLENDTVKSIRKGEIIKKGEYFFTPDNKELKMAGAFYTPHPIVKHIVEETLAPLCLNKKPKDILKIKVCDPAMGSGHFLKGALDYLVEQYLESHFKENIKLSVCRGEAERIILHSCIFGTDINPSAVKLAKMSMWLQTASADSELECLEGQLLCGNSLIDDKFDWEEAYPEIFKEGGFSAIVQNPPYVFARDKKIDNEDKEVFDSCYEWASYQANTYTLFIERSWDLLRKDGRLGAIIPNNWLTIDTCMTFRIGYLSSFEEHVIINSKDKIFENASVDNSIIISSKSEYESLDKELQLYELKDGRYTELGLKKLVSYNGDAIGMTVNRDFNEKLYQQLLTCKTLGELHTVKSGLVAYEVGKGKPKQTKEMKDQRVYHSKTKKNNKFLPYLHGKDVCRFKILKPTEYILYGDNLAAPRKKELYEGPRVLVRQIPSKPPYSINAAFLDEHIINDRNSMIIKFENEQDAFFVLGILNSKTITNWFIQRFDKFQRKTFPQFKVKELQEFPIPSVNKQQRSNLIALTRKIVNAYAEENLEKAKLLESELDELVEFLFTDEELVENKAA